MTTRDRDLALVRRAHSGLTPLSDLADIVQAERELIAADLRKRKEYVLADRYEQGRYLALPADAEQGGR